MRANAFIAIFGLIAVMAEDLKVRGKVIFDDPDVGRAVASVGDRRPSSDGKGKENLWIKDKHTCTPL